MKNTIVILALLIVSVFNSCTPVKFYSDPGLKKESGLKFYPVKPFLQVEREPESGRIVGSSIVYLPDMANPQYMHVKNCIGSAKAELKLADGMLTAFGYESEQVLPETVESLATLLSKGAAAAEDISGLKGSGFKGTANSVQLYEIIMTEGKSFLREVKSE